MILLQDTNDSLEILLGGNVTTNQLPFYTASVDTNTTTFTPNQSNGTSNNTSVVTVLSSPAAGFIRTLKYLSIYNTDTVAATLTVQFNDNTTTRILTKVILQVGDRLEYTDTVGFRVTTSTGVLKTGSTTVALNVFLHGSTNAADNSTYYIGSIADIGVTTIDDAGKRVSSMVAGRLTQVGVTIFIGGTNGTGEFSTFEIVNETTAVSSIITTTAIHSTDSCIAYTLATPLAVNVGDELYVKWITPTWVTNPTAVRQRFTTRTEL
jgi:hypothetical protein